MTEQHYHCPLCGTVLGNEPMVENKAGEFDVLGICLGCKVLVRHLDWFPECIGYNKLVDLQKYGVRFVHKEDLE